MSDVITSKNNNKVKEAFALKGKGGERFLIEGFHLCEMAFEEGYLEEVFALKEPAFKIDNLHLVNKDIIEKLAISKNPEGIVGIARREKKNKALGKRVLVLDRVQDPGNVGTLLRTALAFGFEDIILTLGSSSPFNPKAIASSQGALFKVNILPEQKEDEVISFLKKEGYFLLGTGLKNAKPFEELSLDKNKKIALILGNEGQGMSQGFFESSSLVTKIAISKIESLNVSIAGAIIMNSLKI